MMNTNKFPKTYDELQNADFETLHSMWKYAKENQCGKDSSSKDKKIFKEELQTEFTYADLNKRLEQVADRFDGWIEKNKKISNEPKSNEMLISRKMVNETVRLQNRIPKETYDNLSAFIDGLQKHDIPKILGCIIDKGLEYYDHCTISYSREDKERIR